MQRTVRAHAAVMAESRAGRNGRGLIGMVEGDWHLSVALDRFMVVTD